MGLDLGLWRITVLNSKIQRDRCFEDFDSPVSKINRDFAVNCKGTKINIADQSPEPDTFRPDNVDDAINWVKKNIDHENR